MRRSVTETRIKDTRIKGAVAIWDCTDMFGLAHIAYLKSYGGDNYRLMSRKDGKRDRKLQPKGKGVYFIIPTVELLEDAVGKISTLLAQSSRTVTRRSVERIR